MSTIPHDKDLECDVAHLEAALREVVVRVKLGQSRAHSILRWLRRK